MSTSHQNRSSTIFSSSSSSASNIQSPATGTMGSGPNLSMSSSAATSSGTSSTMVAGSGTAQSTPNSKIPTNATSSSSTNNKTAVVLQGSLRKLKTMKKKYFVLYRDTKDGEARLEYYDSEKKFKAKGAQPKRKILLKNATIGRRLDTKHKCVIGIHNENESFCIVFDSEPELTTWYRACVAIQRGEEISDNQPKSTFEHVWQVQVQKKGLAADKGIIGIYNVCLTEKSLSLTRVGPATTLAGEARMPNVEFLLMTIRCCGFTQIYFYLEVGRHSAIGSGELWMETEDALIAENMSKLIYRAMSASNKNRDDIQPVSRTRSSSESSKPIPVKSMRQTTTAGNRPLNMSLSPTGGTMGRERCDSLPTRNRTASESSNQSIQSSMPPPRTIHSNRPHSIPSGTCSESDGSSVSIDETDGIIHSMITGEDKMSRVGYGQISGATVILEENPDDIMYHERPLQYEKGSKTLVLPITQNQSYGHQRKGSPAPRIGSVEGNNYMEMYSPCSTSPGDPTNAYMTMLPGSPGIDYSRGIYTGSSGAHSRASSIAEDPIDGYVPMLPPQPDEYVDMDPPPHRSYHHHPTNSMSSAASSCSITSGTPSTDMRFAEYHLDKVIARFTPDEEDQSSITERPMRAYSVGSKLEHNKRKFRVEILNSEHQNSRVRAFSVGSRAKVPRSDLYRGVLTPSQTTIANAPEAAQNVTRGKKSSSAPILNMKGTSLIDPMDDLMEIDYSKKDESCTTPISSGELFMTSTKPDDVDDLMEIDFSDNRTATSQKQNTPTSSLPVPVPNASARRYDRPHMNTSPKMMNNFSGYVEMRPQIHTSDPVAIAHKNNDHAYLNMRPIGVSSLSKSPSLSSSPIKSMNSPKTVPLTATSFSSQSLNKSNYADMSSRSLDKIHADDKSLSASSPKTISDDYLNMKPGDIEPKSSDLPKTVSAPEGYMEMGWGKDGRTTTRNAGTDKPNEEYMNVGSGRLASSQPITIRPSGQIYSTFPSNNATNTSPGKTTRVRCDSKDSGIVTPSGSQAAIFPFSPSSPMKNVDPLDRKCFVDGTTGTIRLSEEDEQDYMKSNETLSKNPTQVDDLSSNYATMTIDKKPTSPIVEGPSYVNFSPGGVTSNTPHKTVSPVTTPQFDDGSGDYTFVDPKKIKTQTSIPNYQIPAKTSVLVTVNNNQERIPSFGGFKPISSNADDKPLSVKISGGISSLLNRQLSEKREHEGEQGVGGYEMLQSRNDSKKVALSRPNSVNSEKISSKNSSSNSSLNRPNSANSDRIPFISTSTSSSTLCGSSSSSSTLCGSKSQSPSSASTTPRPQSLGDIGTSRPESVSSMTDAHMTSRPPSVSLERELHYASLDLPPSDDLPVKNPLTPGACESSASASPSPNTGCTGGANSSSSSANSQQSAFTYAQIDFVKITKQSTKSN